MHDYIFLGKENEKISYDLVSLKGKIYNKQLDYLINLDGYFFEDKHDTKLKKDYQTNNIVDRLSNNFNNDDEKGKFEF